MQILATGVTGRIGANIARRFVELGHDVRGFVWPGDRQTEKVASLGVETVEGDLASLDDVRRAADGCEVVFHLGAAFQAGGPFTAAQYFDTNVKGTFNVLEAALGLGDRLRHLIFSSTDATMSKYPPGGIAEPIREDSLPTDTTDWYGYSKVLCEHLVDRYVRAHGLRATVIRFANVWGAGEVLSWPQFRLRFFLNAFAGRTDAVGRATYEKLAAEAEDGVDRLLIACDENGRPYKKHNLEVRDIVHAFEAATGNEATFGNTYQIAGPGPFTWDEAVPFLAEKLGLPYSRVDLAGMNPTFYEYDLTAARRDFGYNPQVGYREAIEEALRYRNEGVTDIIPT